MIHEDTRLKVPRHEMASRDEEFRKYDKPESVQNALAQMELRKPSASLPPRKLVVTYHPIDSE